jgi:CCR4-NOT transcription complex subunit 4
MWCWHRIRESESGLCPACRTPYGDDPHEFSAVDVEEVLKANKEKAAADKMKNSLVAKGGGGGGDSSLPGSDQDRTALANMRVIRRNLVYAVGLPPLSEELLRKADYFGQYGKINKIVLNRNNPPAGDARRASSSAYVTFIHKVRSFSGYR